MINEDRSKSQDMAIKPSYFENLLGKTFKTYFKLFKILIILAIIPSSLQILSSVLTTFMHVTLRSANISEHASVLTLLSTLIALLLPVLLLFIVTVVASIILYLWALGATIKVIASYLEDKTLKVNEALDASKKHILGLFFGGIVVAIRIFIGFFLLIIPGILATFNNCLYQQCIVIEDLDPIEGPAKSRSLIMTRYENYAHPRWYALGGIFIIGAIGMGVSFAINLPSMVLGFLSLSLFSDQSFTQTITSPITTMIMGLTNGVTGFIAASLIFPLIPIFGTILYFDLKAKAQVKKQGEIVQAFKEIENS